MTSQKWGGVWTPAGWKAQIWAPDAKDVTLLLNGRAQPMTRGTEGFWTATTDARPGDRYQFRIGGLDVPDPASRRQADDVHGPSLVMEPADFSWQTSWRGRDWAEAVIYELHVGTFTEQGTLAAAADKLAGLADLGITAVELMPLSQFPGQRGWGYDGVLPSALHPPYGTPDDLRRFVDRAHSLGLMVILDLVMNHFGPEGSYLHHSSPPFFDPERHTPWGAAIDFAQPAVRDYWVECAQYWIGEFRMDGLRLDAVHQIKGPGAEAFMAEFALRVRATDPDRAIHLIVEDERNIPTMRETGYDAAWNDDFHHAIHVHLTGESDGHLVGFAPDPFGDLCLALERGQAEEGQPREGHDTPRGQPSGHLPPTAFVNATQNHDQVGNRAMGDRLLSLADPDAVRVAYALLLTAPYIPLIFMGEERGATTPFMFFAEYDGELAEAIRKGRAAEFAGIAAMGDDVPDPLSPDTFAASRLDWRDDAHARQWQSLTREALEVRARHIVPLLKSGRSAPAECRRHGPASLTARWFFHAGTLDLSLSLGSVAAELAQDENAHFAVGRIGIDPHALSVTARPR